MDFNSMKQHITLLEISDVVRELNDELDYILVGIDEVWKKYFRISIDHNKIVFMGVPIWDIYEREEIYTTKTGLKFQLKNKINDIAYILNKNVFDK